MLPQPDAGSISETEELKLGMGIRPGNDFRCLPGAGPCSLQLCKEIQQFQPVTLVLLKVYRAMLASIAPIDAIRCSLILLRQQPV